MMQEKEVSTLLIITILSVKQTRFFLWCKIVQKMLYLMPPPVTKCPWVTCVGEINTCLADSALENTSDTLARLIYSFNIVFTLDKFQTT